MGAAEKPPVVQSYSLGDIVRDERFKARPLRERTVKNYVAKLHAGERFPPLVLGNINGTLHLLCGWHRYEAHARLGRSHVDAEERKTTPREARWIAAEDNFRHGQPIEAKADLVRAFKAYIGAKKNVVGGRLKSYREMREDLPAVSKSSLERWTKKLFPEVAKAMQERRPEWMDDREEPSAEEINADAARKALEQALAASRGVQARELRDELAATARSLVAALEDEARAPEALPTFVGLANPDF